MIVKEITAKETYKIRKELLRKGLPMSEEMEGDLYDSTFHLGVFFDNKIIGVASFMKKNNLVFKGTQYQLRGMATSHSFQQRGLGTLLLVKGMEILKNKNVELLWCNARVSALQFYLKCGFNRVGKEFEIPLVGPHFVLYKKLN